MDEQGQFAATQMIESLNGWWKLAGFDSAVGEEAVDWLALDAKPEVVARVPVKQVPQQELPAKTKAEWPQDIETLRRMISEGACLMARERSAMAGCSRCQSLHSPVER